MGMFSYETIFSCFDSSLFLLIEYEAIRTTKCCTLPAQMNKLQDSLRYDHYFILTSIYEPRLSYLMLPFMAVRKYYYSLNIMMQFVTPIFQNFHFYHFTLILSYYKTVLSVILDYSDLYGRVTSKSSEN